MANNKKRAGLYKKNKIKTGEFLPSIFQTNVNKRWLDSTLDQMVSKSDLTNIEGFIGKKNSRTASSGDVYVEPKVNTVKRAKAQFSPAIVTKNSDGSTDNVITFDDISGAISSNFDSYNYNAAYASAIYGYYPPIDVDKFINYVNYYWVEELPIYESVNETGDVFNPVIDSLGKEKYALVDDNNTFELENNMIIRFIGSNWDSDIQSCAYIVTGVGISIRLLKYEDGQGKRFYTSSNKGDVALSGAWDNTPYYVVTPNQNNSYWTGSAADTPADMIAQYNADANRLPIFDGFIFSGIESNPTQYTTGVLIKFAGDWNIDELEKSKIYYTEIDSETGNVSIRTIINAEYDISGNIVTSTGLVNLPEDQPILDLLAGWDSEYWDSDISEVILKDYIVIAKEDKYQTAWSRNNNWVNINTIHKLHGLMNNSFDVSEYVNNLRIAQRPIIEMIKDISLWDFSNPEIDNPWLGMVDFILDTVGVQDDGFGNLSYAVLPVVENSLIIFKVPAVDGDAYKKVFRLEASGALTPVQDLQAGNTVFISNVADSSFAEWADSDAYFDGDDWQLGQQKTSVNQSPLYRLYTYENIALEDIPGSIFQGSKIFGYKIGTGNTDPVLGFPLSYKDSPKGAEYEFENFILTEKYSESYTSSIDSKINHYREIPGYYFFKTGLNLKHVYEKSDVIAGTKEEYTYEVTSSDDLEVPFGHNNWRPDREVLLHLYNGLPRISEIVTNGVYLEKLKNVIVGTNQEFVIHNLVPDSTIRLLTIEGYDIENPPVGVTMPDISVIRSGAKITLTIGDLDSEVVKVELTVGTDVLDGAKILINSSSDLQYHSVFVNGKKLAFGDYTIDADKIVIPADLLEIGDLVDFEYYANSAPANAEHTGIPNTLEVNANNEPVLTFTVSETLPHWQSILTQQPGFVGDPYGYNNYSEIVKLNTVGGTILIHPDISIMHDLSYANKSLDVTGALIEQGADWDNFVTRFKNQVKRLYSTKTYHTVYDMVTDAISALVTNRKGSELYKNSNMVFAHRHNEEKITLASLETTVYSKYVVNGDSSIRDHVYVYLTDDKDSNGKFIQRLLVKDVDYTIVGNRIDLLVTPIAHTVNAASPYLTLYYHQMDEDSFVPPSSVKLKLQNAFVPVVYENTLITHDGRTITLNAGAELFDTSSENFDPVNAALFDLEKRVYAGLVSVDTMYGDVTETSLNNYANAYDFLPAQHHSAWYTLETVNNYIEKFYYQWARARDISSLNIDGYYDALDPFTWNYSSIEIDEHFTGNRLPGHWVGAYTTLFGTSTPHITPWHMLGHTFKPSWWDDYYSWTEPTKRAALLKSLELGIVGIPTVTDGILTQNPLYARYYWNWSTNCPVNSSGELESPDVVLGSPSAVNAAQPFEFGDWGPIENQWRQTSQGYNALVDAVIKLNPTRAWTEFFQPGTTEKGNNITANLHVYTKEVPNVNSYPVPGVVYDSVIGAVYFENDVDRFPVDSSVIRIADGPDTIEAITKIAYQEPGGYTSGGTTYKKISGVSVVTRGRGYTSPPSVITTFSESENSDSVIKVTTKQVEQVTCGISQLQYNYILRNQYDVDLAQIYSTLGTQLSQKVGGFTSKHLLNMYAESSLIGSYRLNDSDYSINMYQGYPVEFVTASMVKITKTETGYVVDGVSSQDQEFNFYEPDLTNTSGATTIGVGNTSIRKYQKFAGYPSVLQFGAKLAKVQDTYNFIRGYWHWLELAGYSSDISGDAQATRFVQWAITADDQESITLEIGNKVTFTPISGSLYEYNKFFYHKNDILDVNGDVISNEDVVVDRTDGNVTIKTKDAQNFGSITSAVVYYEHILLFNDVTSYGFRFNTPGLNVRQQRLAVAGQITSDWNGQRSAAGYLVFDDKIVQNFDSSVSAIDDYYRTDVTEFNPALTKTKDLTIGNIDRDWIANLGLNKNTITNFYQGVIKQAGTGNAIDKIARTTILDHGTTTINASEQYMFNQSYFGENKIDKYIEIELSQSDITSNPQIIKFNELSLGESEENIIVYADGDPRIVHALNKTFETIDFDQSSIELLTAGEALDTEVDYVATDVESMNSVFDTTADYAIIPTWNSFTSYKLGDLVRHEGNLYKCTVNATGLVVVQEGTTATGTITNPTFPNGTVAEIAGTTTVFNRTTTVYNEIQALGTVVDPTMLPEETLIINGTAIGFVKETTQTVVTGDAVLLGTISNPQILDVTGQSITVNGTLIDFDTTPADIIENFTGVDNGIPPAIDLEDTFTVAQDITGTEWAVSSVTVDAVLQTAGVDYNVVGQDIVFVSGSEPADGAAIQVTIAHVPLSMTLTDIVDAINGAAITGITASISTDGFNRLKLAFTTTDPNELLVVGASTTNTLLGIDPAGDSVRPPSQVQTVSSYMTLSEIVDQINQVDNLNNVVASTLDSKILLTSPLTTMTLSGSALAILGLSTSYSATTSVVATYSTMTQAIEDINQTLADNSITSVTATIDNSRIKISSTESSLDLGDTSFNTIAGLPSGELVSISDQYENTFNAADWFNITVEDPSADPALFSVWVADDSAYEVNEVDGVTTKFYSWNVFQAQNQYRLYSQGDGIECGICAGTATRDGNDAEVTTNVDHHLNVGDYVMLLNTTTVPNIDGIHRVTRLGVGANGSRVFYIDRFIEKCGNAASILVMRTQRFNTIVDRDIAAASGSWNIPECSKVWTNYDDSDVRTTNVYTRCNTGSTWVLERKTSQRVTNNDLRNAVVYDNNRNEVVAEFEVFDPIRGIIPGVADKELDFKTGFDPATYNTSTDTSYSVDDNDAWAVHQVGKRWWDTSKARYYDYDQGELSYRASYWGRQFNDSEIAVWEWTKSTVAPDDYAQAVAGGISMFGAIASGEAYATYDPISNEMLYYYTQTSEWDASLGKYKDVYYFWVKNKNTIHDKNYTLTSKAVADIISNPTANGISWIAAISSDAVIVGNASYYLSNDSTVLQISRKTTGHAHNSWTLITKERDIIPEYWYIGLRNNMAGRDAYDQTIPSTSLHRLNRYGDDRKLGQAWFPDIRDARYNTVLMINELLSDINLIEDYASTWNRTIGLLGSNGQPILPERMWKWADFVSDDYAEYQEPTYDITSTLELDNIDTDLHTMVRYEFFDPDTNLDRSEIYAYINSVWVLVKKKNSTIEFDPLKLSLTYGWDSQPWDMISWDNTFIADYWRLIIDACRNDFFVGQRISKFNQLFFGVVDYVLSKNKQPNWIHKSTYISLYITSEMETNARKYKRNQINEILGYIGAIKPFHTKISNVYDKYTATEEVSISVDYTETKSISVKYERLNQNFIGTIFDNVSEKQVTFEPTGDREYRIANRVAVLDENNWTVDNIVVGSTLLTPSLDYTVVGQEIIFEEAPSDTIYVNLVPWQENIYDGGTFLADDSQFEVIQECGDFVQPYNYSNSGTTINEYQSTVVDIRPQELLNIIVQTNTDADVVDADTRTFVYVQDYNENRAVFGLVDALKTQLAADFNVADTALEVVDGSAFALNGFAYLNGEIIKFDRSGNMLYIRNRALNGSFTITHYAGEQIVDISDAIMSTVTGNGRMFNIPGLSILDSNGAIQPDELAALGQGLEL